MTQAFAHFVNGPLCGTKHKLESHPPNKWRTPGHFLVRVKDYDTLDPEIASPAMPVHVYWLCYWDNQQTYIYLYEGQEK